MKSCRKAPRILLTVCAAFALAAAAPGDVQAAGGRFDYDAMDGTHNVIANPPNGVCIDLAKTAVGVDNQTGTQVTLYTGKGRLARCTGAKEVVPKYTGITWGSDRPNSMWFGPGAP
ncbi:MULTISPECIES: hypothetical protein [Streptomyces]|uniref:hypothetical protein n=1 Tax=Streptomyces TaxID=1883 RepID=UPI00163CBA63|nr:MULTISPECIES: hypothetical protein [Streptomyces]MBC2875567.1 hypothetical protein [Streptomyces sp. TYQ1024]UBI35801.1 hypothetical protein K7I03_04530 [Streptomyces mobaraensis]UKW28395.1 hypothetical protein MCU78_04530 [Streptomyces sp. TYQ1024]